MKLNRYWQQPCVPFPEEDGVATAQHEMETAADEEAEAARRRATPQGQRDESEASATMAAAAAAGRSSRSLGPVRPTPRIRKAVALAVIFTETNQRVAVPEGKENGFCLDSLSDKWRSRFGLGKGGSLAQNISFIHFFTRFFFSALR